MAPGALNVLEQAIEAQEAATAMLNAQRAIIQVQGKRIASLEEVIRNLCTAIDLDATRMVDTRAVRMLLEPTCVPGDTQALEHDPPPPDTREGRRTLEVPNLSMSDLVEGGLR